MVRQSTILKTLEVLKLIYQSGLSIHGYFKSIDKNPSEFYRKLRKISDEYESKEIEGPDVEELLDLVNKIRNIETVISNIPEEDPNQLQLEFEDYPEEEILDTDEKVESSILRNKDNKISGYKFKVYRRDKTPVTGVLSREEMQTIYRLYSYYGASITQREVSRHFPDYSLVDFKRILRAFNITKASGPFAPHMYEERSEEELKAIHLQEKENDFLKKIEKDELRDLQNTAVKLARKNRELENTIEQLSKDINITIPDNIPNKPVKEGESNKSLIIHLADMHIGAKCESYTMYDNPYNYTEIERRLNVLYDCIDDYGRLDTLIINLLGDSLDGMDNQTARRDHFMPQEMDNMEQLEAFINLTFSFITQCRYLANKVEVYCVKCGNHGGMWEYTANLALKNAINKAYPEIKFTLFSEFIGTYEFKGHTYVICHGKDEKFMKKPLPLNLDERSKVLIQEWLSSRNILGNDNVHFIKGDLHSNALSSCKLFDYRNVLSLFGASDYSNYNFSRNSYGVSYDLFVDDIRTIGTFENI